MAGPPWLSKLRRDEVDRRKQRPVIDRQIAHIKLCFGRLWQILAARYYVAETGLKISITTLKTPTPSAQCRGSPYDESPLAELTVYCRRKKPLIPAGAPPFQAYCRKSRSGCQNYTSNPIVGNPIVILETYSLYHDSIIPIYNKKHYTCTLASGTWRSTQVAERRPNR